MLGNKTLPLLQGVPRPGELPDCRPLRRGPYHDMLQRSTALRSIILIRRDLIPYQQYPKQDHDTKGLKSTRVMKLQSPDAPFFTFKRVPTLKLDCSLICGLQSILIKVRRRSGPNVTPWSGLARWLVGFPYHVRNMRIGQSFKVFSGWTLGLQQQTKEDQ